GELHGGQAGGDGVRAEARGGAAEGPPCAGRRAAGGDRLPPRRRPAGAMGAAGAEAAAEAGGPVGPATSRGQAAGESLEMVLKLVPFRSTSMRWGPRGSPTRPRRGTSAAGSPRATSNG